MRCAWLKTHSFYIGFGNIIWDVLWSIWGFLLLFILYIIYVPIHETSSLTDYFHMTVWKQNAMKWYNDCANWSSCHQVIFCASFWLLDSVGNSCLDFMKGPASAEIFYLQEEHSRARSVNVGHIGHIRTANLHQRRTGDPLFAFTLWLCIQWSQKSATFPPQCASQSIMLLRNLKSPFQQAPNVSDVTNCFIQ